MSNKVPFNFGGLPKEFSNYEKSTIVVLPVPFDKTSTWIKGSEKGPKAIIEASQNMELYDIETNSTVCEKGIFTEKEIIAKSSEEMIEKVYKKVKVLLNDKKFVVTMGGEHTVSLGAIKAHAEFFNNCSILQLDAHTDMRDSYEGSIYNHACVMARAKEITKNIVSVGIRSMDSSELKNIDCGRTFFAHEIHDSKDWAEKAVALLSQNVYVTIDLDVFDPSIMQATGTPEPGGLDWYQVTGLLKTVSEKKNIVGFDVVELCPTKNKAPDFLAAKLIYKILSHRFLK